MCSKLALLPLTVTMALCYNSVTKIDGRSQCVNFLAKVQFDSRAVQAGFACGGGNLQESFACFFIDKFFMP